MQRVEPSLEVNADRYVIADTKSIPNAKADPDVVVIFDLDYDNCADILFDDVVDRECRRNPDKEFVTKVVLHQRALFLEHLEVRIKDAKEKHQTDNILVVVLVGSLRQDIPHDHYNRRGCQNGLCFPNYEALCKEKGWVFSHFLYPDDPKDLELTNGAMFNDQITLLKNPQGFEKDKVNLIRKQVLHVGHKYPTSKLEFNFIDDYPDRSVLEKQVEAFTRLQPTFPDRLALYLTPIYRQNASLKIDESKSFFAPQAAVSIAEAAEIPAQHGWGSLFHRAADAAGGITASLPHALSKTREQTDPNTGRSSPNPF